MLPHPMLRLAGGAHRMAFVVAARSCSSFKAEASVQVITDGPVGLITVNQPTALNALSSQVMRALVDAAQRLDADSGIRCLVITGAGRAFAAGADIKELAGLSHTEAYERRMLEGWTALQQVRLPLVAAVNGMALGGGCELAMMADIIWASEAATFGQPEIQLGVIPGMGATQRLVRAVGLSKAMEMVLTGQRISAQEALRLGLVSRVLPAEQLLPQAMQLARQIAGFSRPVVAKAKSCMHAAHRLGLPDGLAYERQEFWGCYASTDQKEGMRAFIEKRKPVWRHR